MPRWSPDGRWLAFASTRGEDTKAPAALYVLPAEGGEARKLTAQKENVESIVWSPDSTRIAFTARVRDDAYEEEDDRKREPRRFTRVFHKLDSVGWTGDRRKHIFVVEIDGGEATQLTSGDFEHASPAWSPDGKQIVFDGLRDERWDTELINRLYVVDATGGEPKALTGDGGSYESPAFSPDGSRIAFRMYAEDGTYPHHTQLGVMKADGSDEKLLTTSLDRQCAPYPDYREPVWDGDRLAFTIEDGGNVHLYTVAADGSADAGAASWAASRRSPHSTCSTGSSSTPRPRIRRRASSTSERRARSARTSASAFADGRELIEPERFTAVSQDGYEVDAWLVRPPDFDPAARYPAILTIHGGPFTQYGTGFFDEFQVMASGGYVVLFSNPRGGSGYSEEHARAIRGPVGDAGPGWGTRDYEDVMAVVDTALEKFDFVDARPPRRDRRLVRRLHDVVDHRPHEPFQGRDLRARRQQPAQHVRLERPLLGLRAPVRRQRTGTTSTRSSRSHRRRMRRTSRRRCWCLHSEQDLRCNIEQGEHLFTLLRLLGKDVEMLRFPAESHELTRAGSPQHRVTRFEAVLEWFERYLKPTPR